MNLLTILFVSLWTRDGLPTRSSELSTRTSIRHRCHLRAVIQFLWHTPTLQMGTHVVRNFANDISGYKVMANLKWEGNVIVSSESIVFQYGNVLPAAICFMCINNFAIAAHTRRNITRLKQYSCQALQDKCYLYNMDN